MMADSVIHDEDWNSFVGAKLFDLYKTQHDYDTRVIGDIDGLELFAHKLVLSAASPVLKSLLSDETKANGIKIHNISATLWKIVLEFIYTGRVDLNNGNNEKPRLETLKRINSVARDLHIAQLEMATRKLIKGIFESLKAPPRIMNIVPLNQPQRGTPKKQPVTVKTEEREPGEIVIERHAEYDVIIQYGDDDLKTETAPSITGISEDLIKTFGNTENVGFTENVQDMKIQSAVNRSHSNTLVQTQGITSLGNCIERNAQVKFESSQIGAPNIVKIKNLKDEQCDNGETYIQNFGAIQPGEHFEQSKNELSTPAIEGHVVMSSEVVTSCSVLPPDGETNIITHFSPGGIAQIPQEDSVQFSQDTSERLAAENALHDPQLQPEDQVQLRTEEVSFSVDNFAPCKDESNDSVDTVELLEENLSYEKSDNENPEIGTSDTKSDKSKDKTVLCTLCNKTFTAHYFKRHQARVHPESCALHKCVFCEFSTNELHYYYKHMRRHTGGKPYVCRECNQAFDKLYALKDHQVQAHGVEAKCEKCGEKFPSYTKLKYHQYQVHNDNKGPNDKSKHNRRPKMCSMCGYTCYMLGDLRAHEMAHKGIKPFKCPTCDLRFTTKSHMKKHLVIHTNVKPYVCTYCGFASNRRANLRLHERRHTGEKPYECSECKMTFSTSVKLKSHKLASHDIYVPPRKQTILLTEHGASKTKTSPSKIKKRKVDSASNSLNKTQTVLNKPKRGRGRPRTLSNDNENNELASSTAQSTHIELPVTSSVSDIVELEPTPENYQHMPSYVIEYPPNNTQHNIEILIPNQPHVVGNNQQHVGVSDNMNSSLSLYNSGADIFQMPSGVVEEMAITETQDVDVAVESLINLFGNNYPQFKQQHNSGIS